MSKINTLNTLESVFDIADTYNTLDYSKVYEDYSKIYEQVQEEYYKTQPCNVYEEQRVHLMTKGLMKVLYSEQKQKEQK